MSDACVPYDVQDVLRRIRYVGARPKYRFDPSIIEKLVVLLRDHAAADDDDILSARIPERLDQLRRKGFVARRLT